MHQEKQQCANKMLERSVQASKHGCKQCIKKNSIGNVCEEEKHSTQLLGLRDTHNLLYAPFTKQSHHKVHLVAVLELSIVLDLTQQMEFACRYHGI